MDRKVKDGRLRRAARLSVPTCLQCRILITNLALQRGLPEVDGIGSLAYRYGLLRTGGTACCGRCVAASVVPPTWADRRTVLFFGTAMCLRDGLRGFQVHLNQKLCRP